MKFMLLNVKVINEELKWAVHVRNRCSPQISSYHKHLAQSLLQGLISPSHLPLTHTSSFSSISEKIQIFVFIVFLFCFVFLTSGLSKFTSQQLSAFQLKVLLFSHSWLTYMDLAGQTRCIQMQIWGFSLAAGQYCPNKLSINPQLCRIFTWPIRKHEWGRRLVSLNDLLHTHCRSRSAGRRSAVICQLIPEGTWRTAGGGVCHVGTCKLTWQW